MDPIYLDYNSTAPISPVVAEAMMECYREGFVNPASQHRPGQRARRKLEQLRSSLIDSLGGESSGQFPDQLIFTSGGTESNNLAIAGLVGESPGRVLISAIEHPSVIGAAENLVRKGFTVEKIPVDENGVCCLHQLEDLLGQSDLPTRLVCIMLANNETGVIQPVQKIVELCHEKDVLVHCDAVQGVAKIPVSFRELNVDSMAFTAHKFQGPRGIGGLMLQPNLNPHPILFGGFQQTAIRPGTEDVSLVVGMHRAFELSHQNHEQSSRICGLRDHLQQQLVEQIPGSIVNGGLVERVPHTLNISFPGINRQEFLLAADMQNLAISTGSACASGSSEPSHVLVAMKGSEDVIDGSVRISLGPPTTSAETEESIRRIINIYNNLRRSK